MVFVNIVGADAAELPFGGVKRSGFGRELGRYATEEFVNRKMIRVGGDGKAYRRPYRINLLALARILSRASRDPSKRRAPRAGQAAERTSACFRRKSGRLT